MENRPQQWSKLRTKKGLMSLLIVLSFFLQLVIPPSSIMAAEDDFTITTYVLNPTGPVEKNDPFSLTISVRNNKAGADLSNIQAYIEDCSFYPTGGKEIIKWSGDIGTVIFPLTYDGGSRTNINLIITDDNEGDPAKKIKDVGGNPIKITIAAPAVTPTPDPPSIPVDTTKYVPVLQFTGNNTVSGTAGETLGIYFTIKNTSSYSAKDIRIKPDLDENSPFIPNRNSATLLESLSSNSTATFYYSFDISPYAEEKIYPLKFNFEYYNYHNDFFGGSASPRTDNIYIKVTNPNTPPRLSLNAISSLIEMEGAPAEAINTQLKISNLGSLTARDIKVTLQGLKDDGFGLYQDSNLRSLAKIDGNGEAVINYSLLPSARVGKGNYGLIAKIEYKDQEGKDYVDEHHFFVDVEKDAEKEASEKSVPKIILNQYSSNPSIVKAGENFSLNLSFLNTSPNKTVSNIKVYFTVPEGGANSGGSVFSPVKSSNTIFIDSIGPKGNYRKTLEFYTIPDAAPKTYTLTANFEYEDENGESYEAKELIGVPVTQQLKLETSELTLPQEVFLGEPIPVAVDFYNTGKAKLNNLMFKLEGDFGTQNASYYVGNFDVGASDYFEGMVIPSTPGIHEGALVISYEDPTGEDMEIRKTFTLNVIEMPIPEMPPGFDPEGGMKPPGGDTKKNLLIGLGVLGSLIILIVLLKKGVFKKLIPRKKGLTLDE